MISEGDGEMQYIIYYLSKTLLISHQLFKKSLHVKLKHRYITPISNIFSFKPIYRCIKSIWLISHKN